MKKIITTLFLSFIISNIYAQTLDVKWSKVLSLKNDEDGRPTKVIGEDGNYTFIYFSDLRRDDKEHLSIKKFDNSSMKVLASIDLFKKFKTIQPKSFRSAAYHNGNVIVTWVNSTTKKLAVYGAILDDKLEIKVPATLLYEEIVKITNKTVKAATAETFITASKIAPVSLIIEHTMESGDNLKIDAFQFSNDLKKVSHLSKTVDFTLKTYKSLLTGNDETWENLFNYFPGKSGLIGVLDRSNMLTDFKDDLFLGVDFGKQKILTKHLFLSKKRGDFKGIKTDQNIKTSYFIYDTEGSGNITGIGYLEITPLLNVKVLKNSLFTANILKKGFDNFEYLTSKKGQRKEGTGNPLKNGFMHPYNKIEDAIHTPNGITLVSSFYYYKNDANGNIVKVLKRGATIIQLNNSGELQWLKYHHRFYENKSAREGKYATDSKLVFKNGSLYCSFFTDENPKGEKLDKSFRDNSIYIIKLNPSTGKLESEKTLVINAANRKGNFVSKGLGLQKSEDNLYFFGLPKAKDFAGVKSYGNNSGQIARIIIQ